MRRSWVVAASLLAVSRLARADAPKLDWAGPECSGSRAAFEAKLAELVTPADRARLSGTVGVARRGDELGVTLSLSLSGAPLGERRIDVPTCAAAAETAAVTASLAVFSGIEEPAPPAADAKPPPVEPRAAARTHSPPPPPPPSRQALELRAGLLATLDGRALPALAPGAALEIGLGIGRFSAAILAGASFAQEHDIDATGSVRLRLWSAQARGCYAPFASRLVRLDACAGARAFWTRGQGQGFPVDRDGSLLALGPSLELDFSLRAPAPLEWRVELEASTPLSRQRFVVRATEAARLEAVTLSGRLGPVVRF